MLGKGLESLIPASGSKPKDENQKNGVPAPQEPSREPSPPNTQKESRGFEKIEFGIHREPPPRANEIDREKPRERQATQEFVFHIEIEKIKPNPHQPRRDFNEESLKELADSIREFGVIQPLVVSKKEIETPTGTDVEYELIAGERRLMAAKLLGLERVPAIVRKIGVERERLEVAVIENIQRENLNPIETARAFARLQDEFRLTQREIATQLGKSREGVANTLRLLDLPSYIQDALSKGQISESHGRLLLAVTDKAAQESLFRDLVDRHLTTRELKERVLRTKPPHEKTAAPPAMISPELLAFQEKLSSELGTPVKIEKHGETGKITITFYSGEELRNIIQRLGGNDQEP